MTTNKCPITGQPLTNNFTISPQAIQQLQQATKNLHQLIQDANYTISHPPQQKSPHTKTPHTTKPPLNLTLLNKIDTQKDTINNWGPPLTHLNNPSQRYKNANWQAITTLTHTLTTKLQTWEHSPNMIQDITQATQTIHQLIDPPQPTTTTRQLNQAHILHLRNTQDQTITITTQQAHTIWPTITTQTIRQWIRRKKLSRTQDGRIHLADLNTLINTQQTKQDKTSKK